MEIGFNIQRSSTPNGSTTIPNLTGSQDTITGPYIPVYGFGQNSGNLANNAPANSTGLDTTESHTTSQTYNAKLLLATGTYSGLAPPSC